GLRCVQPRQGLAWLGGAAYLTCAIAVWHAVPDHAAKASRGFPAGELARWADGQGMPVVAYRGSWEAASFYRGAAELKVFHLEDSDELAAWLPTQERALVLVRIQEGRYDQFRNLVPHSMQVDQVLGEGSPIRGVLVSRRLQP
ncbi:MAG TPA: hypothetical protein PKD86_14310, partial [Gemmatales bacterium]|nr:hypothetical protein [Gemmatales bacterium]